ncbi:MAG: hypothetical protein HC835_19430 [Oscillatoriales cyanobacterium RM2_1_1]|nr:hypothetical protein [Oscillatoriales cyanobacterium SM2_3_0]NJO47597.1 hypothetical protein [Oscillatoriales cyanobacterium RM2_1_1]
MGVASKYWQLYRLEGSGQCKASELSQARVFFTTHFPQLRNGVDVPDIQVQQELLKFRQESDRVSSMDRDRADLCLLCFISWEIERVCAYLEARYGQDHHFTRQELYPFVLDEQGIYTNSSSQPAYQSFAREILQSFDIDQSSLSTWTNRRVKSHIELNAFLLQRGVYLVSNWAILNDTSPQQLERILGEFCHLTSQEVADNACLLSCYHQIYLKQRLEERQAGSRRRCQPPTPAQYQQIAEIFSQQLGRSFSAKSVALEIQNLSVCLRDYRVLIRGGQVPTESWEQMIADHKHEPMVESRDAEDTSSEVDEFLHHYRQELLACLDSCIDQVTQSRIHRLQSKKQGKTKSEQFLKALNLFHCQGRSMGEIARDLGLKAQYQVSRLLDLKAFRADIRQQLLVELRDRILELAKNYVDTRQLAALDQNLEILLDEQVSQVIQEAESDSHISNHRPLGSLFAQRLCGQIKPGKPENFRSG